MPVCVFHFEWDSCDDVNVARFYFALNIVLYVQIFLSRPIIKLPMYLFEGFKFCIHIDTRWEYLKKRIIIIVGFFVVVSIDSRWTQRLIRLLLIDNFAYKSIFIRLFSDFI